MKRGCDAPDDVEPQGRRQRRQPHRRGVQRRRPLASGIFAAIAGMLHAGRHESGRFPWGDGDELSVIATAVVGGTSLFGGDR